MKYYTIHLKKKKKKKKGGKEEEEEECFKNFNFNFPKIQFRMTLKS
jgi:hypothetical protein